MAHSHMLGRLSKVPDFVPPWARGKPLAECIGCGQIMAWSNGAWLHLREGVIDPGPTTKP